jgi:glycosyltransferase involved in cell wall biosynthesis
MFAGKSISVVIPAYNEEHYVASTLSSIPRFVDQIIVVDDHSTDGTLDRITAAQDSRLVILRHSANLGVGRAIATGYRRALASGADLICVMGADGQMDPEELPSLIRPILKNRALYTKGNRLVHPELLENMPWIRVIGNIGLSVMTKLASGYWHICDSQCGYTVITREALQLLDLNALYDRYGYPNDLLAKLNIHDIPVADVPIRPIYHHNHSGIKIIRALFFMNFVLARSFIYRLWHKYLAPSGGDAQ